MAETRYSNLCFILPECLLKSGPCEFQRDRRKLRLWLIVTSILFALEVLTFAFLLIYGQMGTPGKSAAFVGSIVSPVIGFGYRIFSLVVVYEYVKELDRSDPLL